MWPYVQSLGLSGTYTDYRNTTLVDYDEERAEISVIEKEHWFDRIEHAFEECEAFADSLWAYAESTNYEVTDADLDVTIQQCLFDVGYFNRSHSVEGVSEATLNSSRWDRLANLLTWLECDFEFAEDAPLLSTMWGFPDNPRMEGGDFLVTGGFVKILEQMAAPFEDAIVLNQTVAQVDWSGDDVVVETTTGDVYSAAHVVLTISLGALQGAVAEDPAAPLRFVPPLPDDKVSGINGMSMAFYCKITCTFEDNFWGNNEILFLSRNDTGDLPWAINLDLIYPGSKTLQFHVAYDDAIRYERMDIAEVSANVVEMLGIYLDTADVPSPLNVSTTDWGLDPLFNGSFSNWPFGYVEEEYIQFQEPIDNKLYFAGEASSWLWWGFVHGGIAGGQRAVEEIYAGYGFSPNYYYYYYYYDYGYGSYDYAVDSSYSYSYERIDDDACVDRPTWYKKNDPSKDCTWVAEYAEVRCVNRIKGADQTIPSYSCPATCRTPCDDRDDWYKNGDISKDCAWVAALPSKRCDTKGYDKTRAAEACPTACL